VEVYAEAGGEVVLAELYVGVVDRTVVAYCGKVDVDVVEGGEVDSNVEVVVFVAVGWNMVVGFVVKVGMKGVEEVYVGEVDLVME
jgi:hypothetical protein